MEIESRVVIIKEDHPHVLESALVIEDHPEYNECTVGYVNSSTDTNIIYSRLKYNEVIPYIKDRQISAVMNDNNFLGFVFDLFSDIDLVAHNKKATININKDIQIINIETKEVKGTINLIPIIQDLLFDYHFNKEEINQ